MTEYEEAIKEYHEDNPYRAKLTFEQRCAVYAYMKYRGTPRRVLNKAYGISPRVMAKMIDPNSGVYNKVKETAAQLGMQEFCRTYITEESEKLVITAMKNVSRTHYGEVRTINFDPSGVQDFQTFYAVGGVPVLLYIGIVPVQITWPYRTWGFRIMNHPLIEEAGMWRFPEKDEHFYGRKLNVLKQWLRGKMVERGSMFDWAQFERNWIKEPDFNAVEQEQIKGTIELMKDRHLYPHDEEPNWEVLKDVTFPMLQSTNDLTGWI